MLFLGSYNRYCFNDDYLPTWFADDEKKHFRPQLPVDKDTVERIKAQFRDIAARPIKKAWHLSACVAVGFKSTPSSCLLVCLFVCFIASQHTLNPLRLQQYTTTGYVSSNSCCRSCLGSVCVSPRVSRLCARVSTRESLHNALLLQDIVVRMYVRRSRAPFPMPHCLRWLRHERERSSAR